MNNKIVFRIYSKGLKYSYFFPLKDKKADLLIHTYVDDIMIQLMKELNLDLPEFDPQADPSRQSQRELIEWTIPDYEVRQMRTLYERNCCKAKKKRKIDEVIECKPQLKLKRKIDDVNEVSECKPLLELKPVINLSEPDSKITEISKNNSTILNVVKLESQSSQDLDLIAVRKQDETEDIKHGKTKNWLDEVSSDFTEETNGETLYNNHDESNSSNRVQICQEPGSSENLSQISESTYDSDLNKSPSVINNEIISY